MALSEEIQQTADLIRGDVKAFTAIYHQYHHAVYSNICKYIQRQDIAEDMLQDVFLSLWTQRHTLDDTQSAEAWLFVVSRNKSLTWLKKALTERKVVSSLANEDPAADKADEIQFQSRLDMLQAALNVLPPVRRQIFQLCRLEGKTYKEAALQLKISPALVKENLKSASKQIRSYLAGQYPTIPPTLLFVLLFQ